MAQIKPHIFTLKDGREGTIRSALPNDAAPMLKHIKKSADESTFLTFNSSEFTLTVEEEAQYLQDTLEADTAIYLLAQVNAKIIGNITFRTGKRSRIRHVGEFGMAVQQAFWGQGVGNALLDALLAWGKANSIVRKINLKVRTDNPRAIALYEKKGFVREGILRKEHCVDGIFHDLACMAFFV